MARDPERRPRQIHRTDWLALLCGLLFVGVGIRYLIPPTPDPVSILLILVIGLGFSAFVAIIAKAVRHR
ncbi:MULTISPECIES: hypothetical protein [Microtetraspora]|uniref:XapX domain-containing protein n=1 Tax=Microtetraspora glauca TaxID=1996 RepID=A0ABV3G6J0_MICGL|nr:hypothetical protein [Microtetraspora sp. AC03309]MCC5581434.1 hypothetical protein [Microtetraspora sp. AC03309]